MPKYQGGNKIRFGIQFNTDKSSLQDVKKSLQDLQNIKLNNFAGAQEDLNRIRNTAKDLQGMLTEAFNAKLNTVNIEKFNQSLKNSSHTIQSIYADFSKAGAAGERAFNQMATSVLTTNLQLKQTHSLVNQMGTTMMNTVKWGIASSVFNNITSSVQQAFDYVKALDSALTDIRIVTGDSREEMAQFADQANRAAQSLGRSTMEYSKAALTYYQQGLSDQDVQARTEATLKAQNITGAGSQMADYLTAVWNGYKVANEEAELYVDKLAAVADSSASNMSQLATAMSKVASTANAMGVPIDSLNAQIATIVATTRQAPESVGNALKTIYARINDISTGAEGAQISLGNYSSKMLDVGISVLDANGNLRDTGDVIEEVGEKWAGLSREEQIYLARTMAGQRQYNNLIALFDNWGKYTDLVTVSMESQGATMEKNSRYMESLEAHMNQLGAAGQRVKSAMINADSFKGLVDVGTGLTTVFANFIESIGGGGNALLMFGSIAMQVFSGTIAREIGNFITNIETARKNVSQLQNDIQITKSFKLIDDNNFVQELTGYKEQIQGYYKLLNEEQINSFNNGLNKVAQLKIEQQQLERQKSIIQQITALQGNNSLKVIDDNGHAQIYSDYDVWLQKIQQNQQALKNLKYGTDEFKTSAIALGDTLRASLGDSLFAEFSNNTSYAKLKQDFEAGRISGQEFKRTLDQIVESLKATDPSKYAEIKARLEQVTGETKRAKEALQDYLKQVQRTSNIQAFTKALSGVGQLASGITSLTNITKIWGNENLSTGQKVLQTFTSIASGVGMVVNGAKNMYPLLVKMSSALLGQAGAAGVASGAETAHAITLHGVAAAAKTAIAAIWPMLAIAAAIAAAVIIFKALSDAWNADAIAAQNAAKGAEQAKQAYDDAKKSLDELKTSLDKLNESYQAIDQLTVGTQQWRDAVREVNDEVLALIEKYPELAGYIQNNNGLLKLSEDGQQRVLQLQEATVDAAQRASIAASQNSREASITSQATNLTRSTGADFLTSFDQQTGQQTYKFMDSEGAKEVASKLQSAEEALASSNRVFESSEERTKALAEQLAKQTGQDVELVSALLSDTDGLKALQTAIEANTAATELQTQTTVQQALMNQQWYQGLSDEERQVAVNLDSDVYQDAFNDSLQGWKGFLAGTVSRFDEGQNLQYNGKNVSQDIIDAMSQVYGQQLTWDSNSVRGGDQDRTFNFRDAEGNEKAWGADFVASTMAAKDALEALGNSAQQTTALLGDLADMETNDSNDANSVNARAMREMLAGGDLSEFTEKEVQNIDAYAPQMVKFFDEYAEQAGYEGGKAFQDAFLEQQANTQAQFDKILNGHSKAVQSAFDSIDHTQLSLTAQQSLIQSLQNAFNEGGKEGLQGLKSFYEKINDFDALEKLGEDIDFNTITATELQNQLREAGIATNLTNEELQAYIDAQKRAAGATAEATPEETYKSVHQIIDGLSRGDSIDAQQAQTLRNAGIDVDAYFDKFADGSLKLKTSAEDFYEYANSVSLDPLKEQLQSLAEENIARSQFEQTSDYSASNKGNFNEFSQDANYTDDHGHNYFDGQKLAEQVNFLSTITNLTEEEKQLMAQLAEGQVTAAEKSEEIAKAVAAHKPEWQGNAQAIDANIERMGQLQQEIYNTELDRPLDPDIDQDQWQNLADYLHDYADQLEDVDDHLAEDKQAAEALAEEMLRYDHALEEVADNYEDWMKALQSGTIQQQAEVGAELSNVYSDLLGLPYDNLLSPAFTQSTENLQLMKLAAEGDVEAYNQLMLAAQQDMEAKISLDNTQFWNGKSEVEAAMNQMNFQDIQIGANLDTGNFLNQLTNMVNAAGMSAQQATNYLASMGIDAEVVENKTEGQEKKTVTNITPTPTTESATLDWYRFNPDGSVSPEQITVNVPGVRYDTQPVEISDTKQNVAHSLKVTSAHKSSGGGFKFKNASHGGGASSPKSSGGGSCFAAGTLITTYPNTFKKIEKIQIGDTVLSYNESTKQNEYSTVLQTMIHKTRERIYTIKVGKQKLVVTAIHRFLITRNGIQSWIPVSELQIGDQVLLANGILEKITKIKSKIRKIKVYNFEVSNNHNYYVGKLQILAHNKGGGGGSKPKQATQAKKVTKAKATKQKETIANPYEQVEKSYDRQEAQLKRLEKIEKKITGKDRLKNLNAQTKALEEQNKTIQKRLAISEGTRRGSTGWYKDQIANKDAVFSSLGGDLFDADGQIKDRVKLENAAIKAYNDAVKEADSALSKVQDDYNSFIDDYNNMSGDDQQAHKADKQLWDTKLKNAQDAQKESIKTAEEEYKKRTDLLKDYEKALKEDEKFYEQYVENLQSIIDKNIEKTTLKLTLSVDAGEAQRDYLEFENKVIKKLNDDDILGNATANFKKLRTFFDSGELINSQKVVKDLEKAISQVESKGWSANLGITEEEWNNLKPEDQEVLKQNTLASLQQQLAEANEKLMDNMMQIQDYIDDIKEAYLDAIDQVNDKMGEQIDQYEHVNDLIDHNVKMTQLLYGDKGYQSLNKYYALQRENNEKELESLKMQQDYWQEKMNQEIVGSDAWKKYKENLDDVTDKLNSKMEQMIQNLAKEFENKISAAVDKVNNQMTGGMGLDYVDEQWDYMNNYDDYFLDNFNSATGIEDVTRTYENALAGAAGNPKQYQRINNLMNDQLKILKEKDKLTEYDLERAKSMLEVEQARMALEDARNNKTKMRLRRDSQGNYTYQYIADEQKLGDLQAALADAQNNLYNQDKEHYKENLNKLYDTYKDYIEKMKDLTAEYNATQDEEERARIQARIDLLKESTSAMMDGLTEDNKYNLQYLIQSYSDGRAIDLSKYSPEQQMQMLKDNVPFVFGEIQKLSDKITADGGILPATKEYVQTLNDAITDYDKKAEQIITKGGSSIQSITQGVDQYGQALDKNITNAQNLITANTNLIASCEAEISTIKDMLGYLEEFVNGTIDAESVIATIRGAFDEGQRLAGASTKTYSDKDVEIEGQSITSTKEVARAGSTEKAGNMIEDLTENEEYNGRYQQYLDSQEQAASLGSQFLERMFSSLLDSESAKSLFADVANGGTFDYEAALATVEELSKNQSKMRALEEFGSQAKALIESTTNSDLKKMYNDIVINANFPDTTDAEAIRQAFMNLIAIASMKASETTN